MNILRSICVPGWKNNCNQTYDCPERLASFGIIEADLRAPPETLNTSEHYHIHGFEGGPQIGPLMSGDASLSDSMYFSSVANRL